MVLQALQQNCSLNYYYQISFPPALGLEFVSWKVSIKPVQYFRVTLQWYHHFHNYELNILLTTSLARGIKTDLLT